MKILWLKIMCLMIIFMIIIGGYTRLTDSGLSMTDWKPVTGVLPPLNEASWHVEFESYKQSPEYLKVNNDIDLIQFKTIFYVEFVHRILGRITGLVYLVPLILLIYYKSIGGRELIIYILGLALFIIQAFAGWYMVKSGLVNTPNVSHFRLAIHLLLAIFLYSLLFWQLMNNSFERMLISSKIKLNFFNNILNVSFILLFIQITLGAFVAGLDAGLVYNQFPLMGDNFIPNELTLVKFNLDYFSEPVFIQFIHRIFAYILTISIIIVTIFGLKIDNKLFFKSLLSLAVMLVIQFVIGIFTLVYSVPILIALLHQIGAVILLSMLLWVKWLIKNA